MKRDRFATCGRVGLFRARPGWRLLWMGTLVAAGCVPMRARNAALEDLANSPCDEADRIVVTVNGTTITHGDFYRKVVDKVGMMSLLTRILDEELFRQEADRLGVTVSDEETEEAVQSFLAGMAREKGGMDKVVDMYASGGISLEEIRRELAPNLRIEVLMRKVTKALRKIGDEDLRKYYERSYKRKRYITRHIAYSFSPPEGEAQADEGRLKLLAYNRAARAARLVREGADFATLARMESDDQVTSALGGEFGAVSEDLPLPPEFKEAIFALRPMEVSEPIENPRYPGFHVFQVTGVVPSESFVTCVDKMRNELEEREPAAEELSKVLESLRDRARFEWGN